ncbi:MAG: aldehyde dehydrogenase (NADP(+)) [Bacteroidetes bacterium]|nr:aldehyde dehydrogenase (NADP(+)) [Bacteroidota bacterium]
MSEAILSPTPAGVDKDQSLVNKVMENAQSAFQLYKRIPAEGRALFLETIGKEIEKIREELVATAGQETNLPPARLNGEINRTIGQAGLFAALLREGSWVEAAIDTEDPNRVPAKPDTRKMLMPVGPVVVFGASNFPFAFSTAGGDTVSALASGSSVVVKGHSAHAKTSELVFGAIEKAIEAAGMPPYTVQHLLGSGRSVGTALVVHPHTRGVGFTGSFAGGKALWEAAQKRETPIPVFAEMSSINPVVFFPDTLEKNGAALAKSYAGSITLGMGQFCTNPGVLLAIQSPALDSFLSLLSTEITAIEPAKMLHKGIHEAYCNGLNHMLAQKGLQVVGQATKAPGGMEAQPVVASVSAADFLANPHFTEEVFGPFSLCVVCEDKQQLAEVLKSFKGQLTTTIMATPEDVKTNTDIIELQQTLAGRIILNNVPTGVEVNASMVHGGPWPATTDGRFTSVGSSAIKRWVRPICFQNFLDEMLPVELKRGNPKGIWRVVNNVTTKEG